MEGLRGVEGHSSSSARPCRREQLTSAGCTRRVQEIEKRLDDWLDELPRSRSPELERLDNYIRAHRGEWLVFLHDPEVPPTNNHAEQMLQPAVITRKVGGCSETLLGALVHGILASLMVTCQRQGERFLDVARRLWQTDQPQALVLDSLPPPDCLFRSSPTQLPALSCLF
jgi:hypothetical protein